ncbi:MAG: porin [Mycobacteriales bacterium]
MKSVREGILARALRLCLFALLVALGGVARAQFDHSIYGTLDLSYGRFEPSGQVHDSRINSNSLSASFVGVNAKYGLDSGYSMGLNLETFLRFQDLDYGRSEADKFISRQGFLSLSHADYGLLRVGRLQTYLFETNTRFNAFGNAITFSPSLRHLFLSGGLESVQGDVYWDRAASYSTPRLEGLQGSVMYAMGRGRNRGDYGGANVVFSRGVFAAALSAQRVHIDDGIADETQETAWQLGATYNFGLAKVFGQAWYVDDNGLESKNKGASLGTGIPLGPGSVLAQIAYSRATGPALLRRHTTTSLGYVYNFDSVTDFYILGSDDRVRNQTRGLSWAMGVRYQL